MTDDCRNSVIVRSLPDQEYQACAQAMRTFTDNRTRDTPDEIWMLQHYPVLTQGQAGKAEHLLDAGDIPVVASDRGGQITYHGPGQLVAYLLMDIRRKAMNVRDLVTTIEQGIIELLAGYDIEATTRPGAPGVYTGNAKIAFLGLRVRRGCSYHGLSLNVDMDLEPFSRINPCGFQGLDITQLRDLGVEAGIEEVSGRLRSILTRQFGYHYVSDSNSIE